MKFFHLSDLHFGKQLHGYDLADAQKKLITDIVDHARQEKPDAIIIAGDIYDRSVPSTTAMTLLEDFLVGIDEISREGKAIEVLIIAGNHDSAQRLQYGSSFMKRHHIHIAVFPPQEPEEHISKVMLQDQNGEVNFYLLPYTKPGMLRHMTEEVPVKNSNDAIAYLIGREEIDWEQRNVLVSHQFYMHGGANPMQCDSESPSFYVGGLDGVNTTTVEKFDYVALGHIHSPQNLGDEHIRYSGTPMKYSVSEANQDKSFTVVELGKKGEISYRYLPLHSLYDVRALRGKLEEIASMCGEGICHDYVSIVLTDEETAEQPRDYLEKYYDHILEIQIDNTRTHKIMEEEIADIKEMSVMDAFSAFFSESTGREMDDMEIQKLQQIIDTL